MPLCFRSMRETDLDAVYEIEAVSFSDPWMKEMFNMEMQHDAYVAELDNQVVGYICAWQVLDECTITNISVKPNLRRQGIAEYMFNSINTIMETRGVRYYYLEVRALNSSAIALYQKLQFSQVGLRKDYYHNPTEDALVMSLDKQRV